MTAEDLVTIAKYGNPQEASLLKAVLEDQGIRCYLIGSQSSDMLSIVGTAVGGVQLQVTEHDAEHALSLLRELEDSKESRAHHAWVCSQCGEQVDGGFEICWSCGASIEEGVSALLPIAKRRESAGEPSEEEPLSERGEPTEPQTDEDLVSRAFRAAVLGIGFFPLLVYSLSLLFRVSGQPLSSRALMKYYGTIAIVLFMVAAMTALFVSFRD